MKSLTLLCVLSVALCGCTLFDRQEKRINYTESLNSQYPPSMITDAKQRVVVVTKAHVGVGDYIIGPDGKWQRDPASSDDVVKNHPDNIICAEPSPDVAQAISAAFTAAAQVDAKKAAAPAAGATVGGNQEIAGSGSLGSAYASSLAQLGERLTTVQLLRDKMYRACEAYQNGAISDTSYTLMLSRFDKTMASLLSSEMAAGAFGRNLAALGGSASTRGVDPKALADAKDAVKAAAGELKTASALPDSDATKKGAIQAASDKLDTAVGKLADLELQSAAAAAQSGPVGAGGVIGQITGRSQIDADAIARINENFLDDDASGSILDACVTALDRNRTGPISPELRQKLQEKQNLILGLEQQQRDLRKQAPSTDNFTRQTNNDTQIDTLRAEVRDIYAQARPSLGTMCTQLIDTADKSVVASDGTRSANGLIGLLQANKLDLRKVEADTTKAVAATQLLEKQVDICNDNASKVADPSARMDKLTACLTAINKPAGS